MHVLASTGGASAMISTFSRSSLKSRFTQDEQPIPSICLLILSGRSKIGGKLFRTIQSLKVAAIALGLLALPACQAGKHTICIRDAEIVPTFRSARHPCHQVSAGKLFLRTNYRGVETSGCQSKADRISG